MPPRQISNADLPARLEALDDKIHDLLIKRAQLATATSPSQQAVLLRRLAARHKGSLPVPVLVRVWRELMAASAAPERVVHVYSADRAGQFRDLARDLFGSAVAMKGHLSATAIVQECTGDAATFGVVPPPESDENTRAWWAQLTPSGQRGPRVVATLPLVGGEHPAAYVVGTLEPEPSGDDTTVILLEAGDTLSLTKLQTLLKQGGLEARLLAVSRDAAGSASRQHLLEIAGFVRDDDSRLGVLREQAGDAILRIACVGCYANPLTAGTP
ncbi:MAG TPA: hypothetical protein VNU97_17295 [Rhizomicrobium sp.]|jgi:chorismate mutase/prephenate dehydratase|nr:hypothetical protein [Rhizomicrobium sp.]